MLYYVDVKVCLYVCLSNERILFEDVWKHVWEQVPTWDREIKHLQELYNEKSHSFIKTKYYGQKKKGDRDNWNT